MYGQTKTEIFLLIIKVEGKNNKNKRTRDNKMKKAHKLLNKLVVDGINIDKFEIKKPTLNDIFIEKVGE